MIHEGGAVRKQSPGGIFFDSDSLVLVFPWIENQPFVQLTYLDFVWVCRFPCSRGIPPRLSILQSGYTLPIIIIDCAMA